MTTSHVRSGWFGARLVPFVSIGSVTVGQLHRQMSAVASIRFGVPQGSVLGQNLSVLYAAEAIDIVRKHGFSAHGYADIFSSATRMICLTFATVECILLHCVSFTNARDDFSNFIASILFMLFQYNNIYIVPTCGTCQS